MAIPVSNLEDCRRFYRDLLGFEEGRSSDLWVDFNCFGHQLVIHYKENIEVLSTNPVDGKEVPVPHFGVILEKKEWTKLSEKLINKGVEFIIEPYTRFEGEAGEQSTMFFLDPSGNALEFKAFDDLNLLFAK